MPAVLHQLRMRSIIYVDDGGVLLLRVEAEGLDELVVQGCLAVGSRDHTHGDLGHPVVGLGIHGGLELLDPLPRLHRDNPPLAHILERLEGIDEVVAVGRELRLMPAEL